MMNLSLLASPENDEEAALVLAAFSAFVQSLALKGIAVSMHVTPYTEDEQEENQG